MMQAVYFISGTLTQKEFFHYGLASPIYTHFTSPIRPIGANCRAEMAQMHLGLENGKKKIADPARRRFFEC
jgi:hypothetical protein